MSETRFFTEIRNGPVTIIVERPVSIEVALRPAFAAELLEMLRACMDKMALDQTITCTLDAYRTVKLTITRPQVEQLITELETWIRI